MTATVYGIYKDGKIELLEKPEGLAEGPVRVTVEEDPAKPAPRYLEYGKYKGGRMSTEEDFKEAEWHGEREFAPGNELPGLEALRARRPSDGPGS